MTGEPLTAEVLMAHRGWPARYPENSLAGVRAALDAGARMVEFDVQLTADGVPVVLHDARLARTAGRPESILDVLASALPGFDVGERERLGDGDGATPLPRLADMLALVASYPGATAFIEAKSESIARFGGYALRSALLETLGPRRDHVVIAEDIDLLEGLRRQAGLRIGWIVDALDRGHERRASELEPDFLFCQAASVPAAGDPFWPGDWRWVVYDVADRDHARALIEQGAAVIETDYIGDWLQDGAGETL